MSRRKYSGWLFGGLLMLKKINDLPDLEKRSRLKSGLLKAGAIGLGLVSLGGIAQATSIFWRDESGVLTDLKPVPCEPTSIKKTWVFEKTWNTGDIVFIKTKNVFLANASFVRVYKDGVILPRIPNWSFNTSGISKIGTVDDLVDGVQIASPVNGSIYRVEYDEYLVPFSPQIVLYRTDGYKMSRNLPQNAISGDGGKSGRLTSITDTSDETQLSYTCNYTVPNTFSIPIKYADHGFCGNFDFNKALPTGWRIEIYKQGRRWAGNRASAMGSIIQTMNSTLCPKWVETTNSFDLMGMIARKRTGKWKIRMRNTVTNEVSLFSIQTIKTRTYTLMNPGFTAPISGGRIIRISLD